VATEAAMAVPYEAERPVVSDSSFVIIVYALYGASYFTGFTALVGVIIAHMKCDDADPLLQSHYRFQIRTFWIGLAYFAIGCVLSLVLIGIPILIWWFVWSLIRIVKGLLFILDHKPIVNPKSWLFG
jgi:uncharacterized membrane protein